MRKLPIVILLCLFVIPSGVKGQSYYTSNELGISFGCSQYFGDLNDNYGLRTIGMAGGIYLRRRMNGYISLKVVANYTQVGYDDKYNTDIYSHTRNLNFKSNIIEAAFQAEFNFFKFVTGDPYSRWTPYLTGGIGAFYYDPYTTYDGTRYYLRQLGTEGQYEGYGDRKYGNVSACIPLGLGFKVWLAGGVNLTLEFANRLTLTDYMDDVSSTYVGASKFTENTPVSFLQDRSIEVTPGTPLGRAGKQRGNTSSKDQYFMTQLSVSFHFTTYRCPHQAEEFIRVR